MLLSRLRQLVQPYSMLEIQGPFFDYPMKRGTKWRIYIMVQVKSRTLREQHLKNLLSLCHKDAFLKRTFMGVDIDPLD